MIMLVFGFPNLTSGGDYGHPDINEAPAVGIGLVMMLKLMGLVR